MTKAAIRAGIEILLKEAGIKAAEVEAFIIAGAFGTYIHIPSAILLSMFPRLPLERFRQVGNAAGAGARQLLVSLKRRNLATQIGRHLEYIELAAHPAFMEIYTKALLLER
ncbi:MAG: ASKHA domain-containing protein [Candidatus Villigracilaceae bacterium]